MLFGVPFLGFAIFWECSVLFMTKKVPTGPGSPPGFDVFFPLFGVPFILVGLGLVLSPLWSAIRSGRTAYGITDKAAIVMRGNLFSGREVMRYGPGRLQDITRRERSNGSGDLIFEYVYGGQRGSSWNNSQSWSQPRGFMGIGNVREVDRLLRATLGQAVSGGGAS
jgi:hypothetical protein